MRDYPCKMALDYVMWQRTSLLSLSDDVRHRRSSAFGETEAERQV
jgi:hypothetical protein